MTTAAQVQSSATERTQLPQRRPLFDAARFVAALAVVWLHVPRSSALMASTSLGRFAVPFFTAAAVLFVIQSLAKSRKRTLAEYTRYRFSRIYIPFLAWTVIYLLFKVVKRILAPNQPNDFPGLAAILTGGFYHLWFLPFVLIVTLATFVVARKVIGNTRAEARLALFAAGVGAAIAIAPVPNQLADLGALVEYGWMALPAAFWTVTLAIAYLRGGSQIIESSGATLGGLIVAVVGTIATWYAGCSILAENLAGFGFLVFALGDWKGLYVRQLAVLGPLAYGIYLSHLLFVKSCEAVAAKMHWPETVAGDLTTFAIAVIGSTGLTWLLSRCRWTRWMVA